MQPSVAGVQALQLWNCDTCTIPCDGLTRLKCVRQDHYEEVKTKLTAAVAALKSGSPHEEDTYIGPIIAVKEAQRIEAWVKEALDKGALVLAVLSLAGRPFNFGELPDKIQVITIAILAAVIDIA